MYVTQKILLSCFILFYMKSLKSCMCLTLGAHPVSDQPRLATLGCAALEAGDVPRWGRLGGKPWPGPEAESRPHSASSAVKDSEGRDATLEMSWSNPSSLIKGKRFFILICARSQWWWWGGRLEVLKVCPREAVRPTFRCCTW